MDEAARANDVAQIKSVSSPSSINPSLARYLEVVEAEKKEWKEYATSVRQQYYDFKKDIEKGTKKSWGEKNQRAAVTNYRDYLPAEEVGFLSEVENGLAECSHIRNEATNLNNRLKLMEETLENQKRFNTLVLSNASHFLKSKIKH